MKVLVTGATGYLGSHSIIELVAAGYEVVGIDDFSNSSRSVVQRIDHLVGQAWEFVEMDIADSTSMDTLLRRAKVDAVLHFAGRKYVAESVADPLRYYDRNVGASAALFRVLLNHGVDRIVFSSSCTVYGEPTAVPVDESAEVSPINPYGRSKALVEETLEAMCSTSSTSAVALRYFNPIGAHPSGMLGDVPEGIPNNLVPYVMDVATGRRPKVQVFGGDYDTPDGTCQRDYIHAVDLAQAHVHALDFVSRSTGFEAVNLGTGIGSSVLDVVEACRMATGQAIPYEIVGRRPGDAAVVFADPTMAEQKLGWKASRNLDTMCIDHWNFAREVEHVAV